MVDATENWVILKTYAENDVIFCVEWRCDRTTSGVTLAYGGETYINAPTTASSDEIVSLIMLDLNPSQLEQIRAANSEMAILQARKNNATVTTY